MKHLAYLVTCLLAVASVDAMAQSSAFPWAAGPPAAAPRGVPSLIGWCNSSLSGGFVPCGDRGESQPGAKTVLPFSPAPAVDFSLAADYFITLTGSVNPTFTNLAANRVYTIEFEQDASIGGWVVTWPASWTWAGGTPPSLATAPGSSLIIALSVSGSTTVARVLTYAW